MRFKIISQNCFDVPFLNANRNIKVSKLIDKLISLEPDVICLQELTFPDTRIMTIKKLAIAGYQVFSKRYLLGFNKGGLLIASKFPFLSTKFVPFYDRGEFASLQIADIAISKGYQLAKLLIKGNIVNIVNSHLYCVYSVTNPRQSLAHQNQLKQLSDEIGNLRDATVLAGDLSEPSDRTHNFTNFLKTSNLIDLTANNSNRVDIANTNVVYQNRVFKAKMAGGKFDYLMVSTDLSKNISSIKIFGLDKQMIRGVREHLSDHYGLMASIEI